MKQLFFTFLFITSAVCLRATVITVSNNSNSPGQFTDLQLAADAASNNDTLYLHGSPNTYGSLSLTKPLTIIGAGAIPNKITNSLPTTITYIYLMYNGTFTSNASGSRIYGCRVSLLEFKKGSVNAISNVIINRCKVDYIYFYSDIHPHSNITVSNSVINSLVGYQISANVTNVTIKNNILKSISQFGTAAGSTWIASNNVIFDNINTAHYGVVTNNIFYSLAGNLPMYSNNQNCTVTNNLFISNSATLTPGNIIYGTNSGGNNLINQDPLFVTFGTGDVMNYSNTGPATGPFENYNLNASSPCKLFGTDGTDIGIYGGTTPFVEGSPANSRFRYSPMPEIPQLIDMNILNGSVLPNGTLNVQFKAHTQN